MPASCKSMLLIACARRMPKLCSMLSHAVMLPPQSVCLHANAAQAAAGQEEPRARPGRTRPRPHAGAYAAGHSCSRRTPGQLWPSSHCRVPTTATGIWWPRRIPAARLPSSAAGHVQVMLTGGMQTERDHFGLSPFKSLSVSLNYFT